MRKKDIADSVSAYINKNCGKKQLGLPELEFVVKGLSNVNVSEDSLEQVGNLWTFSATADMTKTDKQGTVITTEPVGLVGNAEIRSYINPHDGKPLPEAHHVTITMITTQK